MKNGLGRIQNAVLFGATSDIGGEILVKLAERGLETVVLCGRDTAAIREQAESLVSRFPELCYQIVRFDAQEVNDLTRVVDEAFTVTGDVDLAVICHGHLEDEHLGLISVEFGVRTAEVNFTSNIGIGLAVADRFRRQSHGTVVFVSSVAGVRVRRSLAVYGAAKNGADSFFRGLDHYLSEFKARAIVVRPGFVRTKMTRGHSVAPFAVSPNEVAGAVIRALDSGQQIVWVPGILRFVFLVLRNLPERLWRALNSSRLETHWSSSASPK